VMLDEVANRTRHGGEDYIIVLRLIRRLRR
jgi:hypothetical protein